MMIRDEQPADINAIRELNYAAFKDHPHHEPGAEPTEHLIVDNLRSSGALTLSLVAEEDGEIVGHIAFSPITIDGESGSWFGLAPVAVLPDKQGQKIGSALINQGIERLKGQGSEVIVLLGEPDYYRRFGFENKPALVLPGVPAEYFMALEIAGSASGEVAYHAAFNS